MFKETANKIFEFIGKVTVITLLGLAAIALIFSIFEWLLSFLIKPLAIALIITLVFLLMKSFWKKHRNNHEKKSR